MADLTPRVLEILVCSQLVLSGSARFPCSADVRPFLTLEIRSRYLRLGTYACTGNSKCLRVSNGSALIIYSWLLSNILLRGLHDITREENSEHGSIPSLHNLGTMRTHQHPVTEEKMSASCHQRQVHAAEVCIRRRHSKRDHQSFQQMTWPEKSPICRRSPQHQLCPGECRCGWVAHSSMLWCHRRHSSCSSGPDSAISTTRGQFDHGVAKMPDHREHCRYPMGM